MCVIAIVRDHDKKPTVDEINKMYDHNSHGAGIAWVEDGKVHWKKGLNLGEIQQMAATKPLPFILHFRIASVGEVIPNLCHPFVVNSGAQFDLSGSTKFPVLFHNGTWSNWRAEVKEIIQRGQLKMPRGKWSDTRGMAFVAFHYGIEYLDLINEKSCVLSPNKDIDVYGTGWSLYEKRYLVSNEFWSRKATYYTPSNWRGTTVERKDEIKPTLIPARAGEMSLVTTLPKEEDNLGKMTDEEFNRLMGEPVSGESTEVSRARETFPVENSTVSGGTPEPAPVEKSAEEVREAKGAGGAPGTNPTSETSSLSGEAQFPQGESFRRAQEDLQSQLKWARSINDKPIHRRVGFTPYETAEDVALQEMDRERRRIDQARGIVHMGRM